MLFQHPENLIENLYDILGTYYISYGLGSLNGLCDELFHNSKNLQRLFVKYRGLMITYKICTIPIILWYYFITE